MTAARRSAPGRAASYVTLVRAPNPGPMTLDGTNTYVLRAPGSAEAIVVDPGPDHPGHREAVLEAATGGGARVVRILLTHRHTDHAGGAEALTAHTGAAVWATHRGTLRDGQHIAVAGVDVDVLATPGHTADSVSFRVRQADALLTGDTVLGRGSTYLDHPDGRLADYLASLEKLRSLLGVEGDLALLPGHGPVHASAAPVVERYLRHRHERLDQVREAVAFGAGDVDAVTARVYADQPAQVQAAARRSVAAQLDYLREQQ